MHSRLMITRLLGVVVVVTVIVRFGTTLAEASPHRTAVLQGLDKVTARVSTLSAPVGAIVRFGTLEVIVRHCDKRPPEEAPERDADEKIFALPESPSKVRIDSQRSRNHAAEGTTGFGETLKQVTTVHETKMELILNIILI